MRKTLFLICLLLFGILLFKQEAPAQEIYETLSGRITKPSGIGLGNVSVEILPITGNCTYWAGTTARTNYFGYYNATVLHDCGLVIIPSYRFYTFTPTARITTIGDSLENIDFVGSPY